MRHAVMVGLFLLSTYGGEAAAQSADTEPLTVNWYHKAVFLQPVIDQFTLDTGIPVRVTDDYDTFTTDVIFVSDYKGLTEAKKFGKFERLASVYADSVVPARWRDRDGYWVGVLLRVRTAVFNKNLVKPADLPRTFEDLADPKWRGRLTVRSASNVYNRSLVAWMIHRQGEAKAEAWARGIIANIGPDAVYQGDTGNADLVGNSKFSLTLMNTYYLGYTNANPAANPTRAAGLPNLAVAWLDGGKHGIPVNVTGVGIHNASRKVGDARKLIEWLLSEKGQRLLSDNVFKYPVRADVEPSRYLQAFGTFRPDTFDLNDLEYNYDRADQLLRRVGWKANW